MSIALRWDRGMPPAVRALVEPVLVQWLCLLPPWLRVLYVNYGVVHPDGEATTASSSVSIAYLFGCLTIYASHIGGTPTQRDNDIVHELLHLQVAEMAEAHTDAIELLLPKGEAPMLRKMCEDAQRVAMERTVCGLAYLLQALPSDQLPLVPYINEVS